MTIGEPPVLAHSKPYDSDSRRPGPRRRRRRRVAARRRRVEAACRCVSAPDQDDHRAARLFDAGGRRRGRWRSQGDGPRRPEGDHLLRGRDDDRAGHRPRARERLPAWLGPRACRTLSPGATRRRLRRSHAISKAAGTWCCTSFPRPLSTRWRAATSFRSWCSRCSSAWRWPRWARADDPCSRLSSRLRTSCSRSRPT